MQRGWADKVQGYKGGWGVIKMKSYLVIQLTLYPIPYTLYPIVFISYSSISYIPGSLTGPLVFVDRHGGLAHSDLPGVLPIVFFMRRRGVLATGLISHLGSVVSPIVFSMRRRGVLATGLFSHLGSAFRRLYLLCAGAVVGHEQPICHPLWLSGTFWWASC